MQDLAQRDAVRQAAASNPQWQAYISSVRPHVLAQVGIAGGTDNGNSSRDSCSSASGGSSSSQSSSSIAQSWRRHNSADCGSGCSSKSSASRTKTAI